MSKPSRGFTIPLTLLPAIKAAGLSLDKMRDMLNHSARITHKLGNRRYHEYVFRVVDDALVSFSKLSGETPQPSRPQAPPQAPEPAVDTRHYRCATCKDKGKVVVFDECLDCDGEGCPSCSSGHVRNYIPCPDCVPREAGVYRGK